MLESDNPRCMDLTQYHFDAIEVMSDEPVTIYAALGYVSTEAEEDFFYEMALRMSYGLPTNTSYIIETETETETEIETEAASSSTWSTTTIALRSFRSVISQSWFGDYYFDLNFPQPKIILKNKIMSQYSRPTCMKTMSE